MDSNNIHRLAYRRQYLLLPFEYNCPFDHVHVNIEARYHLYPHVDLPLARFTADDTQIIILGDIFDYRSPEKGNEAIASDLAIGELEEFLESTSLYSGRYLIIRIKKGAINIVHDCTAARKAYYARNHKGYCFCSQPHLLARILGVEPTRNEDKLSYYRSTVFSALNHSNLTDCTYYDEIRQLMPNHYFDVYQGNYHRFWPNKELHHRTLKEAVELITPMIHGYMRAIRNRYKTMLPVTAGGDSRLLMSATREYKDEVFYYINKELERDNHYKDIRIPKRLFTKLKMDFNILNPPEVVDPDFEKIYYQNNPLAPPDFLNIIYNYYKFFPDRVNLPGNIASAPWGIYDMNHKNVKSGDILEFYGVNQYKFVRDFYRKWMEERREDCNKFNLNIISLFYWEERIANWGNQVSMDKDMAQEDINPYNSRYLNEIFLSVPIRYNNEPDKLIHRNIIFKLWPELMGLPFNPSIRTFLMNILARLGIFTLTSRILYRLSLKR